MKQPTLETERLIIREMLPTDAEGMFAMDSNPNVHKYLGNKPVKTIEQSKKIIEDVRQQYIDRGIGRWVMEDKHTGKFIGWTGFKINTEPLNGRTNLLDIGYRMLESEWGKGYATESAVACMDYLCERGDHPIIYGAAVIDNDASNKILGEKLGMHLTATFTFDGDECYFYEITREEWLARRKES
ncbi:GNAT family N-acetyltransferase [Aureisphaera galaxeae]|uniref:GNAT family N-acetyltransferase n=1 Tax=Aureisphaera galaxeae TaxID=1538023 RepID=UPI0023504FDE|nr:GNAT family N-acetyltransferase [Aureisphaera galaxeae]MDC8004952.1 GNAT family N-acetyltransferase [Aureisphaera galaxeae]